MRGFFTDPSRADDSFVPFKSGNGELVYKYISTSARSASWTATQDCSVILYVESNGSYSATYSVSGITDKNVIYDAGRNSDQCVFVFGKVASGTKCSISLTNPYPSDVTKKRVGIWAIG